MPTKPISNSALRDATAHSQNVICNYDYLTQPKNIIYHEKTTIHIYNASWDMFWSEQKGANSRP